MTEPDRGGAYFIIGLVVVTGVWGVVVALSALALALAGLIAPPTIGGLFAVTFVAALVSVVLSWFFAVAVRLALSP